ncbi:MAG TPA: VWA domain-containing protein, partial [Rhodanobacteraceae bacterium]|nr:VWA domain-containing protein [Rhodanobacteraceae bacterium]
MSAIFSQLHWIHPAWLWALAGVPLLVFATWRRQQGRLALTRLVDPDMLPLLLHGTPRRRLAGALLAGLGWTLATLALAGPAWERLPAPMQQGQGAQVIVLSLSDTMLATDLTPDRLTRARYKVRDLVEASRGEQNALIAYAGAAFVVAPLTTDADTVLNLIDPLQPNVMPVPGNNAASAIELGVKLLAQAGISGGSIVLVTDGADAAAIAAAGKARAAGVTVSVLGVGGSTGAPVRLPGGGFLTDSGGNIVLTKLDADSLSRLAAAGGGRYRTLQAGGADITALHLQSGRRTAPSADAASARAEQWRDRGPWLLLPLLPLLALMFRRGWLVMVALVLLLPLATQPALAADSAAPAPATSVAPAASATASWWDALWRNRDQRAAAALAAGQPQVAATLARDPGLENAAHYRQGDYQAAAQGYAAQPGAAAAYNRGNALAREGQYEPAIKAYDKALAMQPDMADATHNRALVEQALKQQQQQQQQ